jgi:uncharacterized metal-binding protein YceD (DUF177 family)
VKALREYLINFGNLKQGKHEYDFTVDEKFFGEFEYSLVKNGNVKVLLILEKQNENLLILNFNYNGTIDITCDRCLDEFSMPVDSEQRLIVKLDSKEQASDDDEIIFLPAEAYELDISPFIYEYINLSIPLKKVCSEAGKDCNPNMIQYIDGVNNHSQEDTTVDPRWEGLKNLKQNQN